MSIGKNGYYSLKEVLKQDCIYNILLGGRNLGKSYAVKEHCLKSAIKNKKCEIAYIRRYADDIKPNLVDAYFADMPIVKYSNGEYSTISTYRGGIYLANIEENGKIKRGIQIGNVFALNNAERYKSTMYPDITNIIYEEFVTTFNYLRDEPTILLNLISTIARDNKPHVYMIANTINRVCPYFNEWSLTNIPNMPIDTIDIYDFENGKIKILVERTRSREDNENNNSLFFGKAVNSIVKGSWESKEYPHIKGNINKDYNVIYDLQIELLDFNFIVTLAYKDIKPFLYVYESCRDKKYKITDKVTLDNNTHSCLKVGNKVHELIHRLYSENMIFYSTNLCGQDFEQCIKNSSINPFTLR